MPRSSSTFLLRLLLARISIENCGGCINMIKIDFAKIFFEVADAVHRDPETKRLAEEYQRRYGTPTAKELREHFTI